ncbi:MAG: ABC transporter permease subunit [Actinomycetaceae bacterium]|nr:ABC transporter permease subunit [Actinomycetaceae bacterium]
MNWVANNIGWIFHLTWVHFLLASSAILISLFISVPVGWLVNRHRLSREVTVALISALYAIPSLPMFIIIPVLTGVPIRSSATVVIVLSIYAVALLQRTAVNAFGSVPPEVMRSAVALGYSSWQRFWRVELPLAGSVIAAGLRVVVVNTVSLVTVGAVVGIQSIGTLFTDGFQRGIMVEVLAGLIMTIILALLLDAVVVFGSRLVFPWTRTELAKITPPGQPTSQRSTAGAAKGEKR